MDFFRYSIGTLAKAEFLATKMFYGYRRIMGKDGLFEVSKDGLLGWDSGANEDWQIMEFSPGTGDIKALGVALRLLHWHGRRQGGPYSKE